MKCNTNIFLTSLCEPVVRNPILVSEINKKCMVKIVKHKPCELYLMLNPNLKPHAKSNLCNLYHSSDSSNIPLLNPSHVPDSRYLVPVPSRYQAKSSKPQGYSDINYTPN